MGAMIARRQPNRNYPRARIEQKSLNYELSRPSCQTWGLTMWTTRGLAGVWLVSVRLGLNTRWCNGNTRDFGSLIQGSNPCRVVLFPPLIDGRTSLHVSR
jgi:hypothetical protein